MRSLRRILLLAIGIALGGGALVFASLNRQRVPVDLYFIAPIEIPLWTVVLSCLVLGWSIPRLLGLGRWYRGVRERQALRKRLDDLEAEVIKLRNIPLELDGRPPDEHRLPPPTQGTSGLIKVVDVSNADTRALTHDTPLPESRRLPDS